MFSFSELCRPGLATFLLSATLVTAGCSADGLAPAAPRPAPGPLGAPYNPAGNAEFTRNDGIDVINAEAAYLRGANGEGVIVALIDFGIDADHPDLVDNISASSFDVVSGTGDIADATGHGTKVAGVIAAERNGLGTHGVAYEATLLVVKTARCSGGVCHFDLGDLATAVNYATDHLAHVINMSLGGDVPGYQDLNAAVQRAADAGAFVVLAAGNSNDPEPVYPANLAADPSLAGMVVAVGAATDSGTIASFSNDCGAAMNSCLIAPGVGIATTQNGASSATQTTSASGTSFAAPHVSGTLALLIQLYPDAYAADPRSISMFMFDGARDMGAAGVDPVYGHGMLDVAGAIDVADAAIAAATVPLSTGTSASLSGTSLTAAPALGNALSGLSLLDDAIAVIRLSDGAHPYRARLADSIVSAPRGLSLDALIAADTIRTLGQKLGDRMSLSMAMADDDMRADAPWRAEADAPRAEVYGLQLAGSLGDATGVRLGIDVAAPAQLGGTTAVSRARTLFATMDETMSPVILLAGRGNGLSFDRSIGEATSVSLALFEGESADPLAADAGSATTLGQASVSHDFGSADGGTLRLDVGLLDEEAAQLGSHGSGAFTTNSGASTQYMTVHGGVPVGWGIELLGSATVASTDMGNATDGVLSDWGTVRSNAFGIGVVARDVMRAGDRLGLLVGQPLRAVSAGATLTVPVALSEDGRAVQRSERVDVTPRGREIDLQLGYEQMLAPGLEVSSWLMLQLEPGHDADADAGVAAGVRVNLAF